MNVIGYLRCSTREQADSGLGLAAQRSAIEAEVGRRGWTVTRWIEDAGESGKSLDRPGIAEALAILSAPRKRRTADALVVAKLDRISRSVGDFAGLMDRAKRQRWAVVALDFELDTTTPGGKLVANVLMSVAEWEREVIGQRTRDALAERRAAGHRLGKERMIPAAVVARINAEHAAGVSASAIARGLDADAVPTSNGGARWYPSTVSRLLAAEARSLAAS